MANTIPSDHSQGWDWSRLSMRNFILDRGIAQHGVLVADYSLTVSEFCSTVWVP